MSLQGYVFESQGSRPAQEDAACILPAADHAMLLAILADGAGGHRDGAAASRVVVECAQALWETEGRKGIFDAPAFLGSFARRAHEAIRELGSGSRSPRAAVVAMAVAGARAHWMHSGDSRLYHFRGGRCVFRTTDHSVAQLLVDRGKLSESELRGHPDRSTLFRCLGGSEFEEPDCGDATVLTGDRFLLCTDGFWDAIGDDAIAEIMASNPITKLKALFDGSFLPNDNATIILVQ